MDEDPILYAEKLIKVAKEKQLKQETIIAVLTNNIWHNNINVEMYIGSSTSIVEATQRIAQIKLNLSISNYKKNKGKNGYYKGKNLNNSKQNMPN